MDQEEQEHIPREKKPLMTVENTDDTPSRFGSIFELPPYGASPSTMIHCRWFDTNYQLTGDADTVDMDAVLACEQGKEDLQETLQQVFIAEAHREPSTVAFLEAVKSPRARSVNMRGIFYEMFHTQAPYVVECLYTTARSYTDATGELLELDMLFTIVDIDCTRVTREAISILRTGFNRVDVPRFDTDRGIHAGPGTR